MSKKVYKIDTTKENDNKSDLTEFFVGLIVYAIVLMIAGSLFRGIYIENFFYAIIAALILSMLNCFIKPFLVFFTLPLTIMTFGITYPIVNAIILKICDWLMGSAFEMGGLFITFIIAIFISAMKMFLDSIITNNFRRK